MKSSLLVSAGLLCFSKLSVLGSISAEAPENKNIIYQDDKKLNVIFIMVDDMGWPDLGCYGSDLHETPNIDRLAKESMKFTNAYSAAAICTPTRAALMTGKHPARLNMTIWLEYSGEPKPGVHEKLVSPATVSNLPLEEYTIAEALKAEGYYTAHIGKWHLGNAIYYPEAQGFDINIGGTMWGMPYTFWYPFSGWRAIDNEFRYVPGLEDPGRDNENLYLTDRLTDEAIRIIKAKKDEPFFVHLSYYSPHVPLEGKPGYVDYFGDKSNPELYHNNPVYAAMIASIDENVGRILEEVEKAGIYDRTVLFFYSDNGGLATPRVNVNNNYPLRSGKGSLYEGGIRVPLIVKWPGVTSPGSSSDVPVNTMDFYPTILEMANAQGDAGHNKNIDGISIVPVLNNPSYTPERNTLFWHYPHYYQNITTPVSAMRKGNWKMLHYFEDDRLELYNLEKDLGEKNNLAQQYPEKVSELYNILQTWRKDINAQFPTYNSLYKPELWH